MKMKISLLFSLLLLLHTTTHALDITQVLNQFPEFSNFNSYLTQTGLAVIINGRIPPLTILVVDNGNVAPLASKPMNVLKNILSVHVILDYDDLPKLQTLSTTTNLLTTLFQSTGEALGQQGFLNVTRVGVGSIAFSSAMPGSSGPSNYVKSVHAEPYSLSILQISSPIIPQGIDGAKTSSPPSTTPGATLPPPSIAVPPTTSTVTPPSTTTPPTPSTMTPPSTTAPPTPSTMTPPSTTAPPTPSTTTPVPAAAKVSTPPQASTMAPTTAGAAAVPSTAPPTAAKAPIPSTATSPKASAAPIPSMTAPTSSNAAPLPSSISPIAATPSSTPAAAPGSASAPGAAAPTSEEPGESTPARGAPKAKSAAKSLNAGLALASTMVLSAFYLQASSMV